MCLFYCALFAFAPLMPFTPLTPFVPPTPPTPFTPFPFTPSPPFPPPLPPSPSSIPHLPKAPNPPGTRPNTLPSVALNTTLGTAALPTRPSSNARSASSHRPVHRHHLQPSRMPGIARRLLPWAAEKSRNSLVTIAAMAWWPVSWGVVRQKPSRWKPVGGVREWRVRGREKTGGEG